MAKGVPARLTAAQGRKFGVTLGLAFGVFTALFLWRHKPTQAIVAGSLSGAFLTAGLLIPTYLGPVERAWMGMAHLISRVTTPIFMGVVYFVVVTPIGLLRRMFTGSPLVERDRKPTRWAQHAPTVREEMERQF
jgi:hypothetical protein